MSIEKQQVLETFHFRSACRYYDANKKISREDMEYILELGDFRQVLWVLNLGNF